MEEETNSKYQYRLIGIICHNGNAEAGHYISYIKVDSNKWFEFNDSYIYTFNPSSIETECFGGAKEFENSSSSFFNDYQWEQKVQANSKSAYVVLYERVGENNIQILLKNLEERNTILKELTLEEVREKIQEIAETSDDDGKSKEVKQQKEEADKNQNGNQEGFLKQEKQEKAQKQKQEETVQFVVKIGENIQPFIQQKVLSQIKQDNRIHFLQKSLAAEQFVFFFSKIMSLPGSGQQEIIQLIKDMTFGFWQKSPNFKDLLAALLEIIKRNPSLFMNLLEKKQKILSLLIQNSEGNIRTHIANFWAGAMNQFIKLKNLSLTKQNQEDEIIVNHLDHMFSLLPTTVSRCWTKFGEYFQFWMEFIRGGKIQVQYASDRGLIKHFLDYFLGKKSPLMIYANMGVSIGSRYANPNFTMLLRCVAILVQQTVQSGNQLTPDDYSVLLHYDFMQKLVSENNDHRTPTLFKNFCTGNLHASQKVAILIQKGLKRSPYSSLQPYLQILHQFVLIPDQYQQLRIDWVLGRPQLVISTFHRHLSAINGYNLDERIYTIQSTLVFDGGECLVDKIFDQKNKAQNFAMFSLRCLLKLALASPTILEYLYRLPGLTYCYAKFTDFFNAFIKHYTEEPSRIYSHSLLNNMTVNKVQIGGEVKKMWEKIQARFVEEGFQQEVYQERKQMEVQNVQEENGEKDLKNGEKMEAENIETTKIQDLNIKEEDIEDRHIEKKEIEEKDIEEKDIEEKNQDDNDQNQEGTDPQMTQQQKLKHIEQISQEFQPIQPQVQTHQLEVLPPKAKKEKSQIDKNLDSDWTKLQQICIQQPRRDMKAPLAQQVSTQRLVPDKKFFEDINFQDMNYDLPGFGQQQLTSSRTSMDSKELQGSVKTSLDMDSRQQDFSQDNGQVRPLNALNGEWNKPSIGNLHEVSSSSSSEHVQAPPSQPLKACYMPVDFKYIEKSHTYLSELRIAEHQSELTELLLRPTGTNNLSFAINNRSKTKDKLEEEAWENKRVRIVRGLLIKNQSSRELRFQTENGTNQVRAGNSIFVWANEVSNVWAGGWSHDWPKWTLYGDQKAKKDKSFDSFDDN